MIAQLTPEEFEVVKLAVRAFADLPASNATEERRQTVAKQLCRKDFEAPIYCWGCGDELEER